MTELNSKYILLFVIATFLLYHLVGNCGCRVEGFTYGMEGVPFNCSMAKSMAVKAPTIMQCEKDKEELINISNIWCNSLSGKGTPAENNCIQENCNATRNGQDIECKSPF